MSLVRSVWFTSSCQQKSDAICFKPVYDLSANAQKLAQKVTVLRRWLGSVTVRTLRLATARSTVVGSTPGRVAMKWLLPGRVTVYGQVNHLGSLCNQQGQLSLPSLRGR